MVFSIAPPLLAIVVIIGVELVIIIIIVGFLLQKNCGNENKNEISNSGNLYSKEKILEPSVSNGNSCVVENEVIKEKKELSSQTSLNPSAATEEEKRPISSLSSSSSSSSSCFSDQELEEKKKKEKEERDDVKPVKEPAQSTEVLNDQECHNSSSPRSSVSSSCSSSSSSSSSSSESSASSSTQSSSDSPFRQPNEEQNKNLEEPTKINDLEEIKTSSIENAIASEEVLNTVNITNNLPTQETVATQSISSTPSLDLGGITLSLRIEHNNSEPSIHVEPYSPHQKLVRNISESEIETSANAKDFDDGIEVIRSYEMPVKERTTRSSAKRQKEDDFMIEVFSCSEEDYELTEEANDDEDTVAGIINVTSGEKLTICQAVKNGLIPRKTAVLLLEAQAATGSVVNPKNGVKLSVADAVTVGIVDEEYQQTLVAAEGAYYGYMDPRTGENISLSAAMNRNIFPKNQGMRLLEAQVATGGVIDPWTGLRYSLGKAVSKKLLDRKTASLLKNRVKQTEFFDPTTKNRLGYADLLSKCIRDLDTGMKFLYIEEKPKSNENLYQPELLTFRSAFRRKVTLQELIDAGLVEDPTLDAFQSGKITKEELRDILQPYLVGETPIAGIVNKTTNKVRTIGQAVQEGILRRRTALELLEAQAATGSIIDPFSGRKMSLNKALSVGLVDQQFASALKRAEQAVCGYNEPGTKRIISLFEAMKRGVVIENHGIRMLEAQIATGGVIDPEAGYRIPASLALERGLFDDRMSQILTSTNHDLKGYYDPNTGDNLTYGELMQRCVRKKRKYGNLLLLPVYNQGPMAATLQQPPQHHRRTIMSESSHHQGSLSDD